MTATDNHGWRHAEWARSDTRPWMVFAADQADVPPEIREKGLVWLAAQVAKPTGPRLVVRESDLSELELMVLAMALPNLDPADAQTRLVGIVTELNEAKLAADVDAREDGDDYRSPADHTDCADELAQDAVKADLASRTPGLRLVGGRNTAGAR